MHRPYFEGWYFKHQNSTNTVALIPAFHKNRSGVYVASLQIITDENSYNIRFPFAEFFMRKKPFFVQLGENTFSKSGCRLCYHSNTLALEGTLKYGPLTTLPRDIMGPFCAVPFLQCRHSVFSMSHRVNGMVSINGKEFRFQNDPGYLEGDRGTSFPSRYIWTQCLFPGGSVMLSIADIPFLGTHFTGCIGVVVFGGKTYTFATYFGVKLLHISPDHIAVQQKDMHFDVFLLKSNAKPLLAPFRGDLCRTIHESAACKVRYIFQKGGITLFDITSDIAGFENVWG